MRGKGKEMGEKEEMERERSSAGQELQRSVQMPDLFRANQKLKLVK